MTSQAAFALSTFSFIPTRSPLVKTCKQSPPRRLIARRLRATAGDADPEPPTNIDIAEAPQTPATTPPAATPPATPPPDFSELPKEVEDYFESEVPGKIQLTELEIVAQRTALEAYAKELRQKRLGEEREAARLFGFVPYAELLNARFAMFFIVVGLLTEYWTDYTIPEQIELLLRTLGVF